MNKDKIKKVLLKVLKVIGIAFLILFMFTVFMLILVSMKSPSKTNNTVDNKENIVLTSNGTGLGGVENESTNYDTWTSRTYLMNNTLNLTGISPTVQYNFSFKTSASINGTQYTRYGLRFTTAYCQVLTDSNGGRSNIYNYTSNTWSINQKYWFISENPTTTVLAWLNANGTWLNAPVTNYITFYVNNQSFTVEEETTWNTFVSSNQNTIGLYVSDNYVYNSSDQHVLDGSNNFVSATSIIQNNVYYTYLVTDTFYVGAVSYSFVNGYTWTQFVDSAFNTNHRFTINDNAVFYDNLSLIDDEDYPVLARDSVNAITYTTSEYVDYEALYLRLLEEYNKFSSYYWLNQYNNTFTKIEDENGYTWSGANDIPIVYTGGSYARVDFSNMINAFNNYIHNTYSSVTITPKITLTFNSPIYISDLGNYFIGNNITSIDFNSQLEHSLNVVANEGTFDLSSYSFFKRELIVSVTLNFDTFNYGTLYSTYISFNGSNVDIIASNNYERGLQVGRDEGYQTGYDASTEYWTNFYQQEIQRLEDQIEGLANGEGSFNSLFWSIGAVPYGILSSILNFEILGVNVFAVLTGVLTGLIIIWLFRKILGK